METIYIGRNLSYEDKTILFKGLETLKSVIFGEKVTYINNNSFNGCKNLEIVDLSNSITEIGYSAFSGCINMSYISLGDGLTTIGSKAFADCGLQKIFIPKNVKSIGNSAFAIYNLSTLIVEDCDEDITVPIDVGSDYSVFSGATIDSVYLGRSGAPIKYHKVRNLKFGKIKEIGTLSCDTINVLNIAEAQDTLHLYVSRWFNYSNYRYYYTLPFDNIVIDSVYYGRNIDIKDNFNTNMTFYPFAGISSSFKMEIGKNITNIDKNLFNSSKILSLIIPNNVMSIGVSAFSSCSNLSNLTIAEGNETLNFENNVFYGSPLDSIYIGRNISFANNNSPFKYRKEGIKSLKFGNCVTEISDTEFYGLKGLTSIAFPESLKQIGAQAFYGCEGLTEITIPGCVEKIYQQAFDLCRNIKKVSFADGTKNLVFTSNNAFQNSPLEDIYLGRNISFTNSSPLSLFESLKSVTIGNEVTQLYGGIFSGCTGLTSIFIPNSVTTIGNIAFSGCSNLTSVFVERSTPVNISSNSFTNRTNATLYVPKGSKKTYEEADYWKDFMDIIEVGNVNRMLLTETSTTAPEATSNVDVHVTRTIKANEWGTICLPFAMTAEQLKAAFGENVQLKDFTGYDVNDESISVKFASVTNLEANHPYIIKVEKPVSAFLVDGVDIVESADPRVSFAEGGKLKDFVGTLVGYFNFYEAATNTPLFLSGGKFWYASASTQTMDAFRGYFDFGDSPAKGDASRFTMVFIDDNPDAVNNITVKGENNNSNVYDLQGRPMKDSQLKPGLYIRNGKKTVIR